MQDLFRTLGLMAVISFVFVTFPQLAAAHPGHDEALAAGGFLVGLAHPFQGLDHLLVMVGVGLVAARMAAVESNLRMQWDLPVIFVVAVAVGWVLALVGLVLPAMELAIAGSVLVLGLILGLALGLPRTLAFALVAFFGAFHGAAHGAEMPVNAVPLLFAFGFLGATALLHAVGLFFGQIARGRRGSLLLQVLGSGTAAVGAVLLIGAV